MSYTQYPSIGTPRNQAAL